MANRRDPNKVMIGVYVDREVRDAVKSLLESKGVTITDFIYAQFLKLFNKKENELIEELKKRDGRTKEARARKNSSRKKAS